MGSLTGENFKQDRAQCINIGPRLNRAGCTRCLFRRHVARCAHDPPLDRLTQVNLISDGDRGAGRPGLRLPQHFGQAPVEHHQFPKFTDRHVLRLEIAVDDAPVMGVGDRLAGGNEQREQTPQLQCVDAPCAPVLVIALDQLSELLAADILHRVVRLAVGPVPSLVNRNDVGVFQLGIHLRFLNEAVACFAVFIPHVLERLQDHFPL